MPSKASVGDSPSSTAASTPSTSSGPTLTRLRLTSQARAVPLAVLTTIGRPWVRKSMPRRRAWLSFKAIEVAPVSTRNCIGWPPIEPATR